MRMDPIIIVLHDYLNCASTSQFETDWSFLLNLSKKHEVTSVVYTQCKDFIPDKLRSAFERIYGSTLFYYVNRQNVMHKIEDSLFDIDYFIIKGASIAKYYPNPAFRTMGDTDIVVHTSDRDEVDNRLKNLGLNCVSALDNYEWHYYTNDMEFELHDHLVYSEIVNVDIQEEFFNDFWKYVHNNELDWNFHFLFLIFHMRKHFMNKGIGIRHFFDIAVLCSRGPKFNWSWIEDKLKELGLWKFAECVFALNEYWFEVTPPVDIEKMSEKFYLSATELVLKNGVFGFDNEDNRDNAIINNVRATETRKRTMLKLALSKLFPSYEVLISVTRYSYLRNRPYLLPVVWVHRIIRSIANRRVLINMKYVVGTSYVNQDAIMRREELYKDWGV